MSSIILIFTEYLLVYFLRKKGWLHYVYESRELIFIMDWIAIYHCLLSMNIDFLYNVEVVVIMQFIIYDISLTSFCALIGVNLGKVLDILCA
jgi:hypothetical protein